MNKTVIEGVLGESAPRSAFLTQHALLQVSVLT